jgi:hypothetical protein
MRNISNMPFFWTDFVYALERDKPRILNCRESKITDRRRNKALLYLLLLLHFIQHLNGDGLNLRAVSVNWDAFFFYCSSIHESLWKANTLQQSRRNCGN